MGNGGTGQWSNLSQVILWAELWGQSKRGYNFTAYIVCDSLLYFPLFFCTKNVMLPRLLPMCKVSEETDWHFMSLPQKVKSTCFAITNFFRNSFQVSITLSQESSFSVFLLVLWISSAWKVKEISRFLLYWHCSDRVWWPCKCPYTTF